MIDKAAQRRRAQEMSQTLAAQGLEAPKLTYPVSKQSHPNWPFPSRPFPSRPGPKSVTAKPALPPQPASGVLRWDCSGKELQVGDTVATSVDGIVSVLATGQITRFTPDRIEIRVPTSRGAKLVLKYGEAVAKV